MSGNLVDDIEIGKRTRVPKPWQWTKVRIQAARRLAEGSMTIKAIAEELGIGAQTIYDWMDRPEFAERRDMISRQFDAVAFRQGIALKRNRIKALEDLHHSHKIIITERAQEHSNLTGGSSGFICVEDRKTGFGDNEAWVQDLKFDGGLSREYRAVLSQVAEETGQTVSKHEITGADGGPLAVTVGVMDGIAERVRAARAQRAAEGYTEVPQKALSNSCGSSSPEDSEDEA